MTSAGTATDVILDPASVSPSTATSTSSTPPSRATASTSAATAASPSRSMPGNVGSHQPDPELAVPALGRRCAVNNINTPNGAFGRIVLAKPALTNNAPQNILYQDWLYAAVENTDGTFRGLYVTKDRGENWTRVRIASQPTPANTTAVTQALPTNDNTEANNYDVTNSAATQPGPPRQLRLQPDGRSEQPQHRLPRRDQQLPDLRPDPGGPHRDLRRPRLRPLRQRPERRRGPPPRHHRPGQRQRRQLRRPLLPGQPASAASRPATYYVNLRHSPTNPFDLNATLFVFNSNGFTNDGTGVTLDADRRALRRAPGRLDQHPPAPHGGRPADRADPPDRRQRPGRLHRRLQRRRDAQHRGDRHGRLGQRQPQRQPPERPVLLRGGPALVDRGAAGRGPVLRLGHRHRPTPSPTATCSPTAT